MENEKSIWSHNMEALEKKNPTLHQKLLEFKPEKYQLITLPDGLYDLSLNGKCFYGENPSKYSKNIIEESKRAYPKMIVIYGFGLGYILKELLNDFGQDACHIAIVEHDLEVFWHALHIHDWADEIKGFRLEFFISMPLEELESALRIYMAGQDRFSFHRTILPIYDKISMELSPNYYLQFAEKLKLAANYYSINLLSPPEEDTYQAFTNMIQNIPSSLDVPSMHLMQNAFKGFPGILVSTGPSLEGHLEFLKTVNNRAVIICADSALRTLIKNGIIPHFVASLERVTETKHFFSDLPPTPDTWLIMAPIIWPETYSGYSGPRAHVMRSLVQLPFFWPEQKPQFTGNSCSHVGLVALRDMGCDPILFLGQDLAFDRHSKKTHGGDQPEVIAKAEQKVRTISEESVESGNNDLMIEGNNGEKILTSIYLNDFRIKMEDILQTITAKCYNVIPINYGAKIRLCQRIDPSAAPSFLHETRDIVSIIRQKLIPPTDEEKKIKHQFLHDKVQKALEELNFMKSLSLDMLASFSSYFNQFHHDFHPYEFYIPYFKKIDEIMDGLLFGESRRVFVDFIGPQFQEIYLNLTIYSHELLTNKHNNDDKFQLQKQTLFNLFKSLHYWVSRMEHFLLNHQHCWDPNWKNDQENIEERATTPSI
ncbi:MAG: motility associated factor glycosyltransferase family protein [Deltaproteobacteria bacterium]|nr:MAG: motility associated factor glycosyltransferase family protein [Deltaproteobacteria bacterium]